MSVCIAAICRHKDGGKPVPKIFAICDRKASSVEFSNEDAVLKGWHFHPKWLAMYAGNEVSPCAPILRVIAAELVIQENPIAETVKRVFEKYYQLYLSNLAVDRVLGRWRLSMEDFLANGRKKFGADVFDSLVSQIEQIRLQFQFLVCGFDDSGPHIFTVKNPGYVEDRSWTPGYWAIGTGDFAAMSTLGFFKQSVTKSLGAIYYNVMGAKFMAEKATHEVGENSYYWQLGNKGNEDCDGGIEAYVRGVWEKLGQPKIPEWFVSDLDEVFRGTKTSEELSAKLHARQDAAKSTNKPKE